MDGELLSLNHAGRIEIWASRIEERKNSGLTVKAWCEEHGISPKTYFHWQKLVSHAVCEQNTPSFVEIPAQVTATASANKIIATLRSQKLTIEIHRGASDAEIKAIFRGALLC